MLIVFQMISFSCTFRRLFKVVRAMLKLVVHGRENRGKKQKGKSKRERAKGESGRSEEERGSKRRGVVMASQTLCLPEVREQIKKRFFSGLSMY